MRFKNQPTDFIWIPGLTFDDLFIVQDKTYYLIVL